MNQAHEELLGSWRDIPENHHQLESHKFFIAIIQKAKPPFGIKVGSFITALSPKDYLKIPPCLLWMLKDGNS